MHIGDIVIPRGDFVLCCGTGIYGYAVVVSILPLVLISIDCDMVWYKILPSDVESIGQVKQTILDRLITYYQNQISRRDDAYRPY